MNTEPTPLSANDAATSVASLRPLRIWPAIVLLVTMALTAFVPRLLENPPIWIWMVAAFGPALCGLLIALWWLTFSRGSGRERIGGFLGILLAFGATLLLIDKSMLGPATTVLTLPMGTAGFGIGAWLCSRWLTAERTVVAVALAVIGFGYSTLVRSDGMWGNFAISLHWRWEQSGEEQLLAAKDSRQAQDTDEDRIRAAVADVQWPGFRGPNRDSIHQGPAIATDWEATPPELLWKIAVGPGWSSFVVAGDLLFTQEQRGEAETVVCYEADTGLEVWTREFNARFDDPLGGPGPRSTPTLADGALYVLGATGTLTSLDAATGDVIWRQDLQEAAQREPPMWGFASSPLVVGQVVMVHAGGDGELGLLAFDRESGELAWSAASGDHSYSSPQLAEVLGENYVLSLSNAGLDMLDPANGEIKGNFDWPVQQYRSLQPQVLDSQWVIVPSDLAKGTSRVRVEEVGDGLEIEPEWVSRDLCSDFNDFVIYEGDAYGFDNKIFACIDLETGKRNWKGGRYGKGQVLLLEASGTLLVMGEEGQIVLLEASPEKRVELAKFQALEGRTWNHPVIVGDRLYVRNSQEAAAYRLPMAETLVAGEQDAE